MHSWMISGSGHAERARLVRASCASWRSSIARWRRSCSNSCSTPTPLNSRGSSALIVTGTPASRLDRHENIPALPASDWSVVRT
eukprot:1895521-Pyramimonas_sp.AAC.1